MGIFSFLQRKESRDKLTDFVSFSDVSWPSPTFAGVEVTEATAPQLPAVYRCWSLNTETISTLPVDTFAKRGEKRVPYTNPFWLDHPNDWQDWGQFVMQLQLSYESNGNAYVLKASSPGGQLAGLFVLPPSAVEPVIRDGRLMYDVQQKENKIKPYAATEIIHISGLVPAGTLKGLSPIGVALRQTIGTGLAAEQYGAQYFGTGATLSGVITLPATAGQFGEQEANRLAESFQRKHGGISKSHAVGVLTGGAQWTPISVNPEESQFLETRQFTDTQIANVYGIPPEYVTQIEGVKGYVTSLYVRQAAWLLTGINPRLVRIERALSRLLPRGVYIKFNRNAFLQMDPSERVSYYAAAIRDRWMTPDEARALEDMNPIEGGDKPLWSVQWQDGIKGNDVPPAE